MEIKNVSFPNYDLEYFRDSIPAQTDLIKASNLLYHTEKKKELNDDFFTSTGWIWTAIALIVLLLGYMTVKMIGEVKKD